MEQLQIDRDLALQQFDEASRIERQRHAMFYSANVATKADILLARIAKIPGVIPFLESEYAGFDGSYTPAKLAAEDMWGLLYIHSLVNQYESTESAKPSQEQT